MKSHRWMAHTESEIKGKGEHSEKKNFDVLLADVPSDPFVFACARHWDFPFELNPALVAAIQTVFGIGLIGIVQLVKAGIKKIFPKYDTWKPIARHALMYAITLIVSAGVTYFVLTQAAMMATGRFILYTVYAWGLANQWWKALKELIAKNQ